MRIQKIFIVPAIISLLVLSGCTNPSLSTKTPGSSNEMETLAKSKSDCLAAVHTATPDKISSARIFFKQPVPFSEIGQLEQTYDLKATSYSLQTGEVKGNVNRKEDQTMATLIDQEITRLKNFYAPMEKMCEHPTEKTRAGCEEGNKKAEALLKQLAATGPTASSFSASGKISNLYNVNQLPQVDFVHVGDCPGDR